MTVDEHALLGLLGARRRCCARARRAGRDAANAWPPTESRRTTPRSSPISRSATARGLAAIEIWNEPDQANEAYFAGPDKAAALCGDPARRISRHQARRPAACRARRLARGLQRASFLRALYAAGIKGYYDALAVHFYNLTLGSLRSIHEVQLANGDTTPLWLDEFGWSSCWPQPAGSSRNRRA